jgi:hypothetical protein
MVKLIKGKCWRCKESIKGGSICKPCWVNHYQYDKGVLKEIERIRMEMRLK